MNDALQRFRAAGHLAVAEVAALNSLAGTVSAAEEQLRTVQAELINGNSWPGLRIQAAELYAAAGDDKAALAMIAQAVDLGWRDANALAMSPFLRGVSDTATWAQILERIERELTVQRALITGTPSLTGILGEYMEPLASPLKPHIEPCSIAGDLVAAVDRPE